MSTPVDFPLASTAVLFMDFQNGIISRVADQAETLLQRSGTVLDAARAAGVLVAYVKVGFRVGYPELSEQNLFFAPIKKMGVFLLGSQEGAIHSALAPHDSEPTVVKHRVGGFAGTDLEVLLRARKIDTLVLLGIATSGVILSTVRHAADADYRIYVAEDGCADADAETHRVLMEKIFPRQATVTSCEAIAKALRAVTV